MVLPPSVTPSRDDPEEKLPDLDGHALGPETSAPLGTGRPVLPGGRSESAGGRHGHRPDRPQPHRGRPNVDIKLEGFPSVTLHSAIKEIAQSALKVTPKRLSTKSGGELPTKTNPQTGAEEPMSTTYQARARSTTATANIGLGCGQARVHTKWISLGERLWRLITHTFNFKLS